MRQASELQRPRVRRLLRLLAALACGYLAFTLALPARADVISDKQTQRDQLGGVMGQLRGEISTTQNKEAQLDGIISGLNSQISATQAEIAVAQSALQRIKAALAQAEAKLAEARAKLADDKRQLARNMVMVYETEKESTAINNLLTGDFNQFWQQLLQLRRVSQNMKGTVDAVHREQDDVQKHVDEISDEKRSQQRFLSKLAIAQQQLNQELSARQAARQVLAEVASQDQARLADAQQAAQQLDSEISSLKAAQAAAEEARRQAAAARAAAAANGAQTGTSHGGLLGTGIGDSGAGGLHFQWPEHGPITQGFGCTSYYFEPYDPSCPTHHFHSGIDIAPSCGTTIAAAEGGIAYTYYSSYGYGNHIIIVHGNGYSSVYGHMATLSAGNGATVGKGQTIGFEGSTGNSTGCHLHFEIRLNDQAQDPLNYLP